MEQGLSSNLSQWLRFGGQQGAHGPEGYPGSGIDSASLDRAQKLADQGVLLYPPQADVELQTQVRVSAKLTGELPQDEFVLARRTKESLNTQQIGAGDDFLGVIDSDHKHTGPGNDFNIRSLAIHREFLFVVFSLFYRPEL